MFSIITFRIHAESAQIRMYVARSAGGFFAVFDRARGAAVQAGCAHRAGRLDPDRPAVLHTDRLLRTSLRTEPAAGAAILRTERHR